MRKCLVFISLILILTDSIQAQLQAVDSLYLKAYYEIESMLDGKKPLSIKRAVFLSEWAYLDGKLDYKKDFCNEISRIAQYIKTAIALNHFEKYKTAKQFMICNYFFYPCNGNGKVPYTYDHNIEYPRGDWHHQLVSRTLRSHKGQCHSLPMTFKLIAEELGAKAFIARSPGHSYIMYKDEDDHVPEDWVNVELTTHQYFPSFSFKKNYLISDSAVIVGTYMTPLTDLQTVANQLSDLAMGYLAKYNDHYDWFTLACARKSIQYYSKNPNALIIAGKSLDRLIIEQFRRNGGFYDDIIEELYQLSFHYKKMFDETHWTEITKELDDEWIDAWKKQTKPKIITREMYEEIKANSFK